MNNNTPYEDEIKIEKKLHKELVIYDTPSPEVVYEGFDLFGDLFRRGSLNIDHEIEGATKRLEMLKKIKEELGENK